MSGWRVRERRSEGEVVARAARQAERVPVQGDRAACLAEAEQPGGLRAQDCGVAEALEPGRKRPCATRPGPAELAPRPGDRGGEGWPVAEQRRGDGALGGDHRVQLRDRLLPGPPPPPPPPAHPPPRTAAAP